MSDPQKESREIFPVLFEEDDPDLDFRIKSTDPSDDEVVDPKGSSAPASVNSSVSPTSAPAVVTEQTPSLQLASADGQMELPLDPSGDLDVTADAAKDSIPPKESESSKQNGSQEMTPGSSELLASPALPLPPVTPTSSSPAKASDTSSPKRK